MERCGGVRTAVLVGALAALAFALAGGLLVELHEVTDADIFGIDRLLMEWIARATPRAWAPLLFFLTALLAVESWPILGAILALAATLLVVRGYRCEAAGLTVAVLSALAGVALAKLFFQRLRPEVDWAFGTERGYSFPSGHAAFSVVLYGMTAYLFWRITRRRGWALVVAAVAGVLALLTGYSRIYLGVHYPSDVLAGFVVGAVWLGAGILTTEGLALLGHPEGIAAVIERLRAKWRRLASAIERVRRERGMRETPSGRSR